MKRLDPSGFVERLKQQGEREKAGAGNHFFQVG